MGIQNFSRKRGQMIILIALILISILSLTLLTSHSPSPIPANPDIPRKVLRQECRRAVLNALANASQHGNSDPNAFRASIEEQLHKIEQGHFGASIFLTSAPTINILDGSTEANVNLNISYAPIKVVWIEDCRFALKQTVGTPEAKVYATLQLIKLTIPITLTFNGQPATFDSASVTSSSGSFPCVFVKNYGNGQLVLEASIPYAGAGTYNLSLHTIDINGVEVSSNFSIAVS
jgi:hypothetical protein